MKRFLMMLAAAALAMVLLGGTAIGLSAPPRLPDVLAKIEPADRTALLADLLPDNEASFLVVLDRQADLRPASGLIGKEAKGRFVYDALRAVAEATQPELIAALRARGAQVRPFIIVNAIGVHGNLQSLLAAAESAHTARIVADTPIHTDLPTPDPASIDSPSAVEWGVADIGAVAAWSMGYTGTGIVVGGQDTGVLWNHNALKAHYRGWDGFQASHDYNWHDAIHSAPGNACPADSPSPCDDQGHGTHTVGTIVGDDGGNNRIGVAPGAQWIACRNMDRGNGTPTTYLECFEWFLAPYPIGGTIADGDPDRAPDVINNSWGCPIEEGCLTGQEALSGVQVMRAAGILTVVSAGNSGFAGCSSIDDAPAIYAESFSVGAYANNHTIAWFSSLGPVTRDGSGRLKPDIAAPGVGVRSATTPFTNSYTSLQGTSVAAPHVAGAAALLWDAAPYLIGEVDLTEWVLRLSATPTPPNTLCGGETPTSHPNNTWGWGRLNVQAAISATMSLTPSAALTATPISTDTFVLDASASTDPETPSSDLLARWDLGNDGVWDTPWSPGKMITVSLSTPSMPVAVQIADPGGRTDKRPIGLLALDRRFYFPLMFK